MLIGVKRANLRARKAGHGSQVVQQFVSLLLHYRLNVVFVRGRLVYVSVTLYITYSRVVNGSREVSLLDFVLSTRAISSANVVPPQSR